MLGTAFCSSPRDSGPLLRLRDAAAPFPFFSFQVQPAPKLSTYPRDTDMDTHTQRTWTWSVNRQPQTSGASSSTPYHNSPDTGSASHISSTSWARRDTRLLVQHTHHTLQVHKHIDICRSSEH